jgi:hypothetical protein
LPSAIFDCLFAAPRLRTFVVHLQLHAFTLYGATKLVAWATRLLAARAESLGEREAAECSRFQFGTLKRGHHFECNVTRYFMDGVAV